jgi:hypothetical protein
MKKEGRIIVAVVIFAVMILSASAICYFYKAGVFDTDDVIEPEDPVIPETVYDDTEFLLWYRDALNDLQPYNNHIIDALSSQSYYSLEFWAEETEDFIDDELKPKCLDFYLSYDYDNLRDEFYECLVDQSRSCFYMRWGGSYAQDGRYSKATDNINTATSYINKATAHMEKCQDLFDIIESLEK